MARSYLLEKVDTWTVMAVMASHYLVGLYRALGDGRQVAIASQSCGPCEERARRLRLQGRIPPLEAVFRTDHPSEESGEARAWEMLVEVQAGLLAFHGLVEQEHPGKRTLRGSRTSTEKAFQRAIQGYCIAFPIEIATQGVLAALEAATKECVEAFALDIEGASQKEIQCLRAELHSNILGSLTMEAQAFIK